MPAWAFAHSTAARDLRRRGGADRALHADRRGNAFTYPSIGGYDAAEHIAYARSLIEDGEIPHRFGTYYTPPLWYALAGADPVGEAIGMDYPEPWASC